MKSYKYIEFGLDKGLVEYQIDELYGTLTVTIKEVYPKTTEDVIQILEDLVEEI